MINYEFLAQVSSILNEGLWNALQVVCFPILLHIQDRRMLEDRDHWHCLEYEQQLMLLYKETTLDCSHNTNEPSAPRF